jgi:hypothetical protein
VGTQSGDAGRHLKTRGRSERVIHGCSSPHIWGPDAAGHPYRVPGPRSSEAIAEQVFTALADPTWRAILAALAALARDWDGPLDALKDHLDRTAREPATTPIHETRGHHG